MQRARRAYTAMWKNRKRMSGRLTAQCSVTSWLSSVGRSSMAAGIPADERTIDPPNDRSISRPGANSIRGAKLHF